MIGLHDDRCASIKGHFCNCPSAPFMAKVDYRLLMNSRSSPLSSYTDVIGQTKEACLAGIQSLKERYWPGAYGTKEETPPRLMPNGEWQATVHRWEKR